MAAYTVPTIFTAVDKVSSVIAKMQGNVGKFATDSQKKYAQMSRSAQAWSTNARSVAMTTGIMGAAMVAPLVLATKAAADFEDQMATIGTTVGAGNVPLLSKGVLETLKHTTAPLHDLTDALYKITSAGVPASKAIDVLNKSAQLGLIGRGTTVEAADALTSAMNVFKDEGLSTNKVMSMLFQTIATGKTTISGMSESFGATANIIHNGGVRLSDFLAAVKAMTIMGEPATQAMNQIRASVFSLEKPTQRMKYVFKELGVKDIHQLIKKFGDLGGAIQAVEATGKKHGVNMAQAWGKVGSYAAVVNLTSATGNAAYKSGQLAMASSEQAAAAAYALKMKTLAAQLKLAQNNMQAFSIVLGTQLIPVLTRLLPMVTSFISSIGDWINNHKTLTKWIALTVGGIGSLLLVTSAFSLVIAGVADAVKIYAGIQLFFASSTAATTAAVAAETVAVATAGTQLSLFAAEAGVAETAAAGFFAVLSEFAVPAALVALGGLAIWKTLNHPKWQDGQFAGGMPKPSFYSNKDTNSPFSSSDKESAYQKWWLKAANMGTSRDSLGRANFDEKYGQNFQPLLKVPTQMIQTDNNNTTNSKLDIHLHDQGGSVKDLKMTGHNIPVTVTSTTGNK